MCLGVVAAAEVALSQAIPLGSELLVNTYTTSKQIDEAVGMDGDGDFVVAWQSFGQDGEEEGIFGFTGATLTTGAVNLANCTRCDAMAIEPHLQGLT